MKNTIAAVFTTVVVAAAAPSWAGDLADGTILAYDRKANVIVFTDKSVWPLETLETPLPDNLKAGDRIEIDYDSNEDDGVRKVYSVSRLAK